MAPAVRVQKMHTVDHRYPARPAFPARWLYGLWRALLGDEFVFVTVACGLRLCQTRLDPQNLRRLDISNGCRNHTLLPYAATFLHASSGGRVRPADMWRRR